ncbi:MAG: glycosyltransferase family 4 protein [Ignavibacteriales bacterium]|nr:glycosyltransferase family 4 protein [Ignavibacteriales bacterium]
MNILYLTFFYKPDLSAGSFRNTALVDMLKKKIQPTDRIDVLTTIPNRYHSYKTQAESIEVDGNVHIHRIKLSEHKNGFADQIFSFRDYYQSVLKFTKNKDYDLIYASSSKLFTAFLAARIANKKKIPLYLDIRDIFVDTLNEVLKNKYVKAVIIPLLRMVEKYTVNSATHINFVSRGFENYFDRIYRGPKSFFTNGIDDEFLNMSKPISTNGNGQNGKIKIITYAGNIGEGQGLDKIIPEAAKKLEGKYLFKIIGDGGAKKVLLNKLAEMKIINVEILQPVSREKLKQYYSDSDFLFLHLNDYEAFKKVLPSKIFEYAATNKGIIAGVGGYAGEFIKENLPDAILFCPGNHFEFLEKLNMYKANGTTRTSFIDKFSRGKIMDEMASSILDILKLKPGVKVTLKKILFVQKSTEYSDRAILN